MDISNVELQATEGKTYNYCLINVLAKGDGTTLNLDKVTAVMAVESKGNDGYASIIRTGNQGEAKTVTINMKDSSFDTTGATGRSGIVVMKDTTASVCLVDSVIRTKDAFPIRSNDQDISLENSALTSLTEKYQSYPIEGYEAKIGDTFYNFESAVAYANTAEEDITIRLVTDFTMNTCTVNNVNGKRILLDGNGMTVTTSGGNNAFVVGSRVAFENLKINHKHTGSVIHITSIATVDLTNVEIEATEGKAYNYALINVLAAGDGTTLNLNGVKAVMAVAGRGKDANAAIIRTGNSDAKTVTINLTDCSFDTTKATGRSGIVVMPKTAATLNLTNTTIKTLDVSTIKSNEQTISQTIRLAGCTLDSDTEQVKREIIQGYDAQIEDTVYLNLEDAIAAANASEEDVTVTLLSDVAIKDNCDIQNGKGKTITVDGNGHTVTAQGGNNTFRITGPETCTVEFKNMVIDHRNVGAVIQIRDAAKNTTLRLVDVSIDATKGTSYDYALINVLAAGGTSTLDFTGVEVMMKTESGGKDDCACIIRTGNHGEAKTVNINLTDCKLDATDAAGRSGIIVMRGTTAAIDLKNTRIKTRNASGIRSVEQSAGQATVSDDSWFVAGKAEELEGYAVRVDNTWYVNAGSDELVEIIRNAGEDLTITLSSDQELDLNGLRNENGKTVTIEVNGYCLTTTGVREESLIILSEAQMTLGEKRLYLDLEEAIEKANSAAEDVVIDLSGDCTLHLTDIYNENGKAIVIDPQGARITATGTLRSSVTILSEARYSDKNETVYLSFKEALAKANASEADATVGLLKDITVVENVDIKNVNGKKVVIDGNYHTVTAQGGNNTFRITGPETCTVEIKNMTIDHQNRGAVVQIRDNAKNTTLELTNVVIEATKGAKYEWCLINTLAAGGTSTLNLTAVEIKMATATAGNDNYAAIIRTGNAGEEKTVNMNLTDCSLDTTGATKRSGIMVMKKTAATIHLVNTSIKTMDTYAIRAADQADVQALTMSGCTLDSLAGEYADDPILNIPSDRITVDSDNAAAAASVTAEEEEQDTKTVILEVPARLYEAFIDWIRQFAKANGWDLGL